LFGFKRTQYIPRFGGVLQECGDFYLEELGQGCRIIWQVFY